MIDGEKFVKWDEVSTLFMYTVHVYYIGKLIRVFYVNFLHYDKSYNYELVKKISTTIENISYDNVQTGINKMPG